MAKILFVQNYEDELLGIESIVSYLGSRHQSKVALGTFKDIVAKYNLFKPDIVGIFALTKDQNWVEALAEKIKSLNKNTMVLVGGQHPTFYTDIIHDRNIDAICIGEGEKAVLNLLNSVDSGKGYESIPSIWIKRNNKLYTNGVDTLLKPEEIPMPDRSIYDEYLNVSGSRSICVMCSRGCPFNCHFCSNYGFQKLYGKSYFRVRKIEEIMQEIEIVKKRTNITTIKFQDDIFGLDKKWLKEFLLLYKQRVGIPFYCLLRCEYVTEENIKQLKEAGCFRIGIGLESGDEHIRNKVLNKRLSNDSIKKASGILKSFKMEFHTFNMFGLPEENLKSALKTLHLNIQIKPDTAFSNLFQPYPGSKFFTDEIIKKIINPDFDRFKVNKSYSKDSVRIQRLQKLLMITVRFPLIRYLLPLLLRMPLDRLYDRISQASWSLLYHKKIVQKR